MGYPQSSLVFASLVCFTNSALAFSVINLVDEFPPSGTFTSGSFDILDGTGIAGMDGINDVTISLANGGAGVVNGVTGATSWDVSGSGIRNNMSFTGAVASNNPGTRLSSTLTLTLGSHLQVFAEDFEVDFSSINTRGIGWEHAQIEFLDVSGNPFAPIGAHAAYLSHTSIDGFGTTGNYHADSLGTVTGVGTNQTSSGTSGGNNNLTSAPGGDLDAVEAGIAPGTQIGGVRWTTYLDDVRGIDNNNTAFTATLTEVNIAGTVVPEPSTALLFSFLGGAFLLRRKRA